MNAGHRLRKRRKCCDAHERVCDVCRVCGAGVYRLRKLVLHGGASREALRLELRVDGVPAQLSNESWWAQDVQLTYQSQEQISFSSGMVLFLVGHDAFYVLAVLAMPLFALNTPGTTRKYNSLPDLGVRLFGVLACCLLIWYQRMLDFLTVGDKDQTLRSLAALGTNDLTPMGYKTASGLGSVAMAACSVLAYVLFALFLNLFRFWFVGGTIASSRPKLFSKWKSEWIRRQVHPGCRERCLALVGLGPDPLWSTPDRELEPQLYFESICQMRLRKARNHVRLMLRGQGEVERAWEVEVAKRHEAERRAWSERATRAARRLWRCLSHRLTPCWRTTSRQGGANAVVSRRGWLGSMASIPFVNDAITEVLDLKAIADRVKAAELDKRVFRAFLDSRAAYQHPERLKLACALSLWICFMFALVLINLSEWIATSIEYATILWPSTAEQALHSDQLGESTRLAATSLQALLLLGASDVCQDKTTRRIVVPLVRWILRSAVALSLLATCLNWFAIFSSFKDHALRLRRGDYFMPMQVHNLGMDLKFREEGVNRYIGYQVSHMTFGFLLLTGAVVLLLAPIVPIVLSVLSILSPAIFEFVVDFMLALLATVGLLLLTLGFQILMNRLVFFRRTWIQHRSLYAFYDYTLTYANALLGLASVVSRLFLTILFFFIYFPRIDRSSMPGPTGGLAALDAGFGAYVAALRIEHRYNHPVVLVFGELMIQHLERQRALLRIRTVMGKQQDVNVRRASLGGRKRSVIGSLTAPRSRWQHAAVLALRWSRRRRRTIRNRWQLAHFVLLNPTLRAYRSHAVYKHDPNPELLVAKMRASAEGLAASKRSSSPSARGASQATRTTHGLPGREGTRFRSTKQPSQASHLDKATEYAESVSQMLKSEERAREEREAERERRARFSVATRADAQLSLVRAKQAEETELLEHKVDVAREEANRARDSCARWCEAHERDTEQIQALSKQAATERSAAAHLRLLAAGQHAVAQGTRRMYAQKSRCRTHETALSLISEQEQRVALVHERDSLLSQMEAMESTHQLEQAKLSSQVALLQEQLASAQHKTHRLPHKCDQPTSAATQSPVVEPFPETRAPPPLPGSLCNRRCLQFGGSGGRTNMDGAGSKASGKSGSGSGGSGGGSILSAPMPSVRDRQGHTATASVEADVSNDTVEVLTSVIHKGDTQLEC